MKTTLFGAIGLALLVAVTASLVSPQAAVFAQRPSAYDSTQLIALPVQIDSAHQQITVIDPVKRAMCVYHIDLPSGLVTLKSVRNIFGDLQIDEFNGVSPLPRDIRAQLDRH